MKRFKKSFMKFVAILLSLAVTFGVGSPVQAIPDEAYASQGQTVATEDNIETKEAEELDETETQ